MALKGLSSFQRFDLETFLKDKRIIYVKAEPWIEDEKEVGSKVTVQIIEDNTVYPKAEITNFGEQLIIKVKSVAPSDYGKLKSLATEVQVTDVEKAVLYGEYRNQLSITAGLFMQSVGLLLALQSLNFAK